MISISLETSPLEKELQARTNRLTTHRAASVYQLSSHALSYVWGYRDGSGTEGPESEAWDFMMAYWQHALEHEETGKMRINIKDAYQSWSETGEIKRD